MKKKILFLDHEQDIAAALNMALEEGGYEVDSFTDPALALKKLGWLRTI
jgi:DNA-binding response OmpR family regulator